MPNPNLFTSRSDVKLAESSKDGGHTSFNKVSDEETISNINRFLDGLNWPITKVSFIRAIYNDNRTYDDIHVVDQSGLPGRRMTLEARIETDALITTSLRLALLLPIADCYPLTIFDPTRKVLALAHLSWHATHAHLLQKLVKKLVSEFDCRPQDLLCYFGPGIPAKDYIYDDPLQLTLPGWKPYLHKVEDGYQIDLLGYNQDQLLQAGVLPENIEISPRNTVDNDELESHYMHTKQNLPVARRYLTAVMMTD